MPQEQSDSVLVEMKAVKMLLILQLLRGGAKQSDIAKILGVSDATISRMLPKEIKASLKGKFDG